MTAFNNIYIPDNSIVGEMFLNSLFLMFTIVKMLYLKKIFLSGVICESVLFFSKNKFKYYPMMKVCSCLYSSWCLFSNWWRHSKSVDPSVKLEQMNSSELEIFPQNFVIIRRRNFLHVFQLEKQDSFRFTSKQFLQTGNFVVFKPLVQILNSGSFRYDSARTCNRHQWNFRNIFDQRSDNLFLSYAFRWAESFVHNSQELFHLFLLQGIWKQPLMVNWFFSKIILKQGVL